MYTENIETIIFNGVATIVEKYTFSKGIGTFRWY